MHADRNGYVTYTHLYSLVLGLLALVGGSLGWALAEQAKYYARSVDAVNERIDRFEDTTERRLQRIENKIDEIKK